MSRYVQATSHDDLFSRIKKALSLPGETTSASLIMDAGSLVRVNATVMVTRDQLEKLAEILEDANVSVDGQIELFGNLVSNSES